MSLVFLKLGGSLITDKTRPYTPRPEKLADLAAQIAAALREDAALQLLLGHGSGSFGHEAARAYTLQRGVSGYEAWRGFGEVWFQAAALNRLVVDALHQAGLVVIGFPPSACVSAREGRILHWDTTPIETALAGRLLPVVHGDVVFDEVRGGTILSTEDLFAHLAPRFQPQRILLAGLEAGVWTDFPSRTSLLREITPESFSRQIERLGEAAGSDVTGGMRSKVSSMLKLVRQVDGLEVSIFAGEPPDALRRALLGERPGTCLRR